MATSKRMVLIILCVIISLASPSLSKIAFAWNDCPQGIVNDPYPGLDSNYIDTNNDKICDHSQSATKPSGTIQKDNYHLFFISSLLIILYGTSYFLSKRGAITLATHRKIWNFLLLISFALCGISSILWLLKTNYNLSLLPNSLYNSLYLSFWHIESGIVMINICLFHTLWHWKYFKNVTKLS